MLLLLVAHNNATTTQSPKSRMDRNMWVLSVGVKSNPVIVLWVHSFSAPGVEGGDGFLLSIVWIFGVNSLWWLMRRPGQVEGAGHALVSLSLHSYSYQ